MIYCWWHEGKKKDDDKIRITAFPVFAVTLARFSTSLSFSLPPRPPPLPSPLDGHVGAITLAPETRKRSILPSTPSQQARLGWMIRMDTQSASHTVACSTSTPTFLSCVWVLP